MKHTTPTLIHANSWELTTSCWYCPSSAILYIYDSVARCPPWSLFDQANVVQQSTGQQNNHNIHFTMSRFERPNKQIKQRGCNFYTMSSLTCSCVLVTTLTKSLWVMKSQTIQKWCFKRLISKNHIQQLVSVRKSSLIFKRLTTLAKLRKIQANSSKGFGWLEYDSSVENYY